MKAMGGNTMPPRPDGRAVHSLLHTQDMPTGERCRGVRLLPRHGLMFVAQERCVSNSPDAAGSVEQCDADNFVRYVSHHWQRMVKASLPGVWGISIFF